MPGVKALVEVIDIAFFLKINVANIPAIIALMVIIIENSMFLNANHLSSS